DAWNVARRQHGNHAWCLLDFRKVHGNDLGVRDGRKPQIGMQRAGGFRHVVDIDGFASDMLVRGIVRAPIADSATDLARRKIRNQMLVHDVAPAMRDTFIMRPRSGKSSSSAFRRWSADGGGEAGSSPSASDIRRKHARR